MYKIICAKTTFLVYWKEHQEILIKTMRNDMKKSFDTYKTHLKIEIFKYNYVIS